MLNRIYMDEVNERRMKFIADGAVQVKSKRLKKNTFILCVEQLDMAER